MNSAAGTTIREIVDSHAAAAPARAFLISPETGRSYTWQQLAAAMPAVSALAAQLGAVPGGAPLATMMGNGWASAQLMLGGLYGGHVMLPLNLAAGDAQIAYALEQSGCQAVVCDAENEARLQEIVGSKPIRTAVVGRDDGVAAAGKVPSLPPPRPEARALLMYTSGTTGMPKGVVHTQRSMLAGGANVVAAHRLGAADRALCVLPLYHINGLCVTLMAPLLSGGSVAMPHRFRTESFWQIIAAHGCTWFSVVPTLISYLLQGEAPPAPLPQLRFGRSASAPLSPAVQQSFEQRFQVPIIETMGLTETAAQILSNPLPPGTRKVGSPGVAVGNEVAVLDAGGNVCGDNETGELAVRGDNVMQEYNDNPQETAAAMAADGWLLTGDLGHRDGDGYFFVTGRRKELIIKGGENIAPREIDEALLQLPQVVEAAAFACKCERYGQRVEACVRLKDGAAIGEEALIRHCHRIIGRFKSPDRIHFADSLPYGPSGKVQRLKLAAQMEAAGGQK